MLISYPVIYLQVTIVLEYMEQGIYILHYILYIEIRICEGKFRSKKP